MSTGGVKCRDELAKAGIERVTLPGAQAFGATTAGGHRYGELVDALRDLIDTVCVADAPEEAVEEAIGSLAQVTALLGKHVGSPGSQPAGHRWDLPARGHPLIVPLRIEHITDTEMRGRVRFSSAHKAHPGIAHGGFVPLVFDEALGVFATRFDPPPRTASLTVEYRSGTPVEVELDVRCRLVRHDGRKLHVSGDLRHEGRLVAEAEALFVQPRAAT